MKIENLEQLFANGLQYVYDGEIQLTQALPKLAAASSSSQLRDAFESHLKETKEHVKRAEQIFSMLNQQPKPAPNKVITQMRQEADQMMQRTDQGPFRDAALIVAGNQVEHYEMASYGSLLSFAELLGKKDIVKLLQQTLLQEKQADTKLTAVGEKYVNKAALKASAAGA